MQGFVFCIGKYLDMNKQVPFAISTLAFCLLITVAACNKTRTVKPARKAITEAVYASGFIVAQDEYKVYALADGYIVKKFKKDGDDVATGDALFHVQNDALAARAGASSSAYDLAKQNAGENSTVLTDLKNKIRSAEAKFKNDSLQFIRYKNMLDAGAVTKAQYDQIALAYEVSGNDLKSAYQMYQQRKDQLQVELKNAQSTLASSSFDLNNYVIKSMLNGTVYETYKELGEAVRRNDLVALVGDKDHKLLRLSVDQQDIDKVKVGQKVVVKMDVTGDKIYNAHITKVYPGMNQNDQSFKVEAEFDDNFNPEFIHTSVEANIIIATKDNALIIPKNVVQANDEVEIKGSTGISRVKIKAGISNLEFVEVLEGVKEGDEIVIPE